MAPLAVSRVRNRAVHQAITELAASETGDYVVFKFAIGPLRPSASTLSTSAAGRGSASFTIRDICNRAVD